jgi:acrylyl-CoA reductase (NADPH)
LDIDTLEFLTGEIGLSQVIDSATALLEGRIRGRVVVDTSR